MVAGGAVAGKEELRRPARSGAPPALPGVHWLGPRRDVGDLMADLDVFVQVSTEPEPFGLVVVEALASGVPVVAGAAGGPLEILAEAEPDAGRVRAAGWSQPGDAAALAAAVAGPAPGRAVRAPPAGGPASRSASPAGARFAARLRPGGRPGDSGAAS